MNNSADLEKPGAVRYFRRFEWYCLFSILGAELVLAHSLPPNILSDWPILGALVDLVQRIAPVLSNITVNSAPHPEAVRLYVVLTLFVMPIKAWLFYRWINAPDLGIRRFLVVSPLMDQMPASSDYFMLEPLRRERGIVIKQQPRSLVSRLFWSTLILLLTAGGLWMILQYFRPPAEQQYSDGGAFISLVSEGYSMWLSWTLQLITFESFCLAVSSFIVHDYLKILAKSEKN
jgi:hypothetical protein